MTDLFDLDIFPSVLYVPSGSGKSFEIEKLAHNNWSKLRGMSDYSAQKTTVVNPIVDLNTAWMFLERSPFIVDGDTVISSTIGFPHTPEWWNVLDDDALNQFTESATREQLLASRGRILLTGVQPRSEDMLVKSLLDYQMTLGSVAFVLVPESQHRSNIYDRASRPDNSQPADWEEILAVRENWKDEWDEVHEVESLQALIKSLYMKYDYFYRRYIRIWVVGGQYIADTRPYYRNKRDGIEMKRVWTGDESVGRHPRISREMHGSVDSTYDIMEAPSQGVRIYPSDPAWQTAVRLSIT